MRIPLRVFGCALLLAGLAVAQSTQNQTDVRVAGQGGAAVSGQGTQSQTGAQAGAGAGAQAGVGGTQAGAQTDAQASGTVTTQRNGQQARDERERPQNELQLDANTTIQAVLNRTVESRRAKEGDRVEARVVQDVVSEGKVIIPRNTRLIGRVTQVGTQAAAQGAGQAQAQQGGTQAQGAGQAQGATQSQAGSTQAQAQGEAQAALGIVFERAQLRRGDERPINVVIQAIGAPVRQQMQSTDDGFGAPGAGATGAAGGDAGLGGTVGGVGGVAGGVGSTVGGAAGTTGGAVGGTLGGATDTVGSATGAAGQTVGAAGRATTAAGGQLTAASQGVAGLKDLQLHSQAGTQGSLITSTGKNVRLESGTQLLLRAQTE